MDKSLGTLLRFWGVFQFTQVQPPRSPHSTNNVGRVYQEFFRVSTLYRVGEGELQENFEKDATTVPMTLSRPRFFKVWVALSTG